MKVILGNKDRRTNNPLSKAKVILYGTPGASSNASVFRILENGDLRITENGNFRILE